MGDSEAEFLTPAEVALLLGVAPVTVRAWAGRDLKAERVTPGGHLCEWRSRKASSRCTTSPRSTRRAARSPASRR